MHSQSIALTLTRVTFNGWPLSLNLQGHVIRTPHVHGFAMESSLFEWLQKQDAREYLEAIAAGEGKGWVRGGLPRGFVIELPRNTEERDCFIEFDADSVTSIEWSRT